MEGECYAPTYVQVCNERNDKILRIFHTSALLFVRIFETVFGMLRSLELDRTKYDAVSSVLLIDLLIEFTNFHPENLQRLPRSVDATKSKWWQ